MLRSIHSNITNFYCDGTPNYFFVYVSVTIIKKYFWVMSLQKFSNWWYYYINLPNIPTGSKLTCNVFPYSLLHSSSLLNEIGFHVTRLESRKQLTFPLSTSRTNNHLHSPIIKACRINNNICRAVDIPDKTRRVTDHVASQKCFIYI